MSDKPHLGPDVRLPVELRRTVRAQGLEVRVPRHGRRPLRPRPPPCHDRLPAHRHLCFLLGQAHLSSDQPEKSALVCLDVREWPATSGLIQPEQ